jgi:hypothetical protein
VVSPPVVAATPVLGAASSRATGAAGAAGAARPAGTVFPSPLPVGAAGLLPGREILHNLSWISFDNDPLNQRHL